MQGVQSQVAALFVLRVRRPRRRHSRDRTQNAVIREDHVAYTALHAHAWHHPRTGLGTCRAQHARPNSLPRGLLTTHLVTACCGEKQSLKSIKRGAVEVGLGWEFKKWQIDLVSKNYSILTTITVNKWERTIIFAVTIEKWETTN